MLKASSSSFYRNVFLRLASPALQANRISSFRPTRRRINTPGVAVNFFYPNHRRRARLLKIHRVLLHVDHLLSKRKWTEAWYYLHSKLSPSSEHGSRTDNRGWSRVVGLDTNLDRYQVYENAASLFASYERFDEALEILNRMRDEGFVPTLSLRTKITTYSLVKEEIEADDLFETLEEEALKDPAYSENALLQLIRFLSDTLSFSPTSINHIVELWSKHHGTISSPTTLAYLVYIHARIGILDVAQNWLRVHAEKAAERGHSPDPAPYTSYLSTISRIRPRPIEELSQAFTQMRKDGVAPDVAVFNALISSQIRCYQLDKAFQTYALLYECRTKHLTPDSFTFSSLFRALTRRRQRPTRSTSTSDLKQDIRDLYNDLLECHLIQTKGRLTTCSSTLNPSVLNNALETFMAYHDYAAAYVVLQSFRQCNLHANTETCRIIVKMLLFRIRKESRLYAGRVGRTWVGRFLGRRPREGADANEDLVALSDEEITDRILIHASNPPSKSAASSQKPDSPDAAEGSLLRPAIFSSRMGRGSVLPRFDVVILKRIVNRAFSVDVTSPYHIACRVSDGIKPAKIFSSAMVQAKNTMIPDVDAMKRYFKLKNLQAQEQVKTAVKG
jgi:pentatricopeptide repeat protein